MALSGSVSTNKYVGNGFSMGMKCTWSATQSVSDNKSILTWTLASDGGAGFSAYTGNVSLTINGVPVLSIVSRFTMEGGGAWSRTGTLEIPHNSDGTKSFAISIVAGIWAYTSDNTKGSGTFELDQIPRKSILSASDGTLGTEQILTVTRQANNFTHTITYASGSESGTICDKSSNTSVRWTPPISLANQNKTGSSVSVTLTIETFSGSSSVGSSSITITCAIPNSVAPTVSIETTDAKGYFDRYGGYVQNRSQCRVQLDASGTQGASIKSYSISCAGQSASSRYATFELPVSGTVTITATVTDSRGRTASASTTINVLPYSNPAVTAISAFRSDSRGNANNGGSYMCVKFSAAITSLSNKNTARYEIEYRTFGSSSWTTVRPNASGFTPTDISTVISAATGSSYEVRVVASDNFTEAQSVVVPVMSSYALVHWDKTNNRIGLGKVAEGSNLLDVGLDAYFRGAVGFENIPPQLFGVNDYFAGVGISVGQNILALPNGVYSYDGGVTEDQRKQMNLPVSSWHYDILVMSNFKVDASNKDKNIYKVILCFTYEGDLFINRGVWEFWNGWKKVSTAEVVDGVAEWENPPLEFGVEYRTTERAIGLPVYTKLVWYGGLPNNNVYGLAHGASVAQIMRCVGIGTTSGVSFPSDTVSVWADRTKVYYRTTANHSSEQGAVQIWYTK